MFFCFFSIVTDSILWNGCNVRGQCIRPAWLLDSPILWPAGGLGKEKRVLQNRWSSQRCVSEVSYRSVWFISLCVPVSQPLLILSSMAFWRLSRCPVSGLVCCLSRGRSSLPCLSECYGIVHLWFVGSVCPLDGVLVEQMFLIACGCAYVPDVLVWGVCCGVCGAQSSGQWWLQLLSQCLASVWLVNFLSVLF